MKILINPSLLTPDLILARTKKIGETFELVLSGPGEGVVVADCRELNKHEPYSDPGVMSLAAIQLISLPLVLQSIARIHCFKDSTVRTSFITVSLEFVY